MADHNFKNYADEEAEGILHGERLLPPEAVMERWGITRRQLLEIARGENPNIYLPAYRISRKIIRFKVSDIIEAERKARRI